jgi:hypothetical protein
MISHPAKFQAPDSLLPCRRSIVNPTTEDTGRINALSSSGAPKQNLVFTNNQPTVVYADEQWSFTYSSHEYCSETRAANAKTRAIYNAENEAMMHRTKLDNHKNSAKKAEHEARSIRNTSSTY